MRVFAEWKKWKVSLPHAPGATPIYTVTTYDGLGRTVSVALPSGAGTTSYVYQGNTTKVTDPAGNWKLFTNDVFGNLLSVTEPDPAAEFAHPAWPTSII